MTMKRKVLKVGNASLAVSLPSKWAKEHKLEPGDEVEVEEKEALVISKGTYTPEKKAKSVSIDDISVFTLACMLTVFYRTNYERVTLTFTKSDIYHDKHRKRVPIASTVRALIDRFIGAEIISQTGRSIEIEFFVETGMYDATRIEKRVYFLLKETFDEMLAATRSDYEGFHQTIEDRHNNLAKFVNYYLRVLATTEKSVEEKTLAYALYVSVDKAVDKLRHISERIRANGCDERLREMLQEIFTFYLQQFVFLEKPALEDGLVKKRQELRAKLTDERWAPKQYPVLAEANILLDTLRIFSELAVVKEHAA